MNHIVLFEPEIPQNTGNIMRTCVATGTKLHLIKPLGFSLDEKYLIRSSVNYIDKLDYAVYEDFEQFQSMNDGIYYYFTRYGKKPHTSFDYTNEEGKDLYFIFGKESTGLPKELLQGDLEHCMRIPMTEDVRALNLSNCCAIVIYEVQRQQHYNNLLKMEPELYKGCDYLEK